MKRYNEQVIRRVWQIWYENRQFRYFLLVSGTEKEMWDYLDSEMGYVGRYHALTEAEIRQARDLGVPVYLAPQD